MKSIIIIFTVTLVMFITFSCEENFSPKFNFIEKQILYCIINTDSSIQTAILQKSYSVDGFDPYLNTIDPAIKGADIRLRQGNNVFFMKDTSIARLDTSRYKSPISFYYTNNFFLQGDDSLEIIVTLPGGKKLSSVTSLANNIEFDTSSDHIIPSSEKDYFSFVWNADGINKWYLPKFTFYYLLDGVRFEKVVASEYVFEDGSWTASYPKITQSNVIRFKNNALDSAFAQISIGNPNKSSFRILGGVFTLLIFNESLSNYYSTSNGYLDDFTIRVDESDYTNINGGLGIFGAFKKQLSGSRFTENYIRSFGYTPELP